MSKNERFRLAQLQLGNVEWENLRESNGPATEVELGIRQLLVANSAEEAERAYWKIENHVVVQGQLFQSALPTMQVLFAMLCCPEAPRYCRIAALELIFQIVSGEAHADEVTVGNGELGVKCRNEALRGLWLLYRECVDGERDAAIEILSVVETERWRLAAVSAN